METFGPVEDCEILDGRKGFLYKKERLTEIEIIGKTYIRNPAGKGGQHTSTISAQRTSTYSAQRLAGQATYCHCKLRLNPIHQMRLLDRPFVFLIDPGLAFAAAHKSVVVPHDKYIINGL